MNEPHKTEQVVFRYPDALRVATVSAGCKVVRVPYIERLMTFEELADLAARYPGTDSFSPFHFGARRYVDTGQRDADGRRIFAVEVER